MERTLDSLPRTFASGAAGTAVLSALVAPALRRGWLRLDFGRVLGTALAPDGPDTRTVGWALYALTGMALPLGYRVLFELSGRGPSARLGAVIGVAHGAAALAGLASARRLHPRPRQADLRPPDEYGALTLAALLAGHVLYGAVVGAVLSATRRPDAVAS